MSPDELPPGFRSGDRTAGDKAYTDSTQITFTLKEGGRGEPWLLIEEDEPGLPVLRAGDAFLGVHFRDGVSYERALDFAGLLMD